MSSAFFLDENAVQPVLDPADEVLSPSFFAGLIRSTFNRQTDGMATTVLLTAPDRGCGVTFLCSSIAAELAAAGGKVLLADAQALASISDAKSALASCKCVGPDRVWVLGHGQLSPKDSATWPRLGSPIATLEALRPEFTSIVIDAPALAVNSAALLLATSVTGIVLVAEPGKTEARSITSACKQLHSLGARILGSIYNER